MPSLLLVMHFWWGLGTPANMRLVTGSPRPLLVALLALSLAAVLPQLSWGATPFPQDLEPISIVGRECKRQMYCVAIVIFCPGVDAWEWMHGSVDKEYSTFFGQNILCTRLLSRVLHVGSWLKYAIIKFRVESKSYTLIILDMKTIDFSDIHCTVILDHVEYPSVAPNQWGGLRRRSLW